MPAEYEVETRGKQVEEAHDKAEKQEVANKTWTKDTCRYSPSSLSHAQHVQNVPITDLPMAQHRRKAKRMITVHPNQDVDVVYIKRDGSSALALVQLIRQGQHNQRHDQQRQRPWRSLRPRTCSSCSTAARIKSRRPPCFFSMPRAKRLLFIFSFPLSFFAGPNHSSDILRVVSRHTVMALRHLQHDSTA